MTQWGLDLQRRVNLQNLSDDTRSTVFHVSCIVFDFRNIEEGFFELSCVLILRRLDYSCKLSLELQSFCPPGRRKGTLMSMAAIKEYPDRSLVNGGSHIEISAEQKKAFTNHHCDVYNQLTIRTGPLSNMCKP